MTLHDAIRRLANESKLSQAAREAVLDLVDGSDQAQIDANIDEVMGQIDGVQSRIDELESRVERLEAEHDHGQE